MDILCSVRSDAKTHPTVKAVLACFKVKDATDYDKLWQWFAKQNATVRKNERIERHHNNLFPDIHAAFSMIVLRLCDDRGHAIDDFDLFFTGKRNDPSNLSPNFYRDRQRNTRVVRILSYFVNHDKMHGMGPVEYKGEVLRKLLPGVRQLGSSGGKECTDLRRKLFLSGG